MPEAGAPAFRFTAFEIAISERGLRCGTNSRVRNRPGEGGGGGTWGQARS